MFKSIIKISVSIFFLSVSLNAIAQNKTSQQPKSYCDSLPELKRLNKIAPSLTKKFFSCGGKYHGNYISLESNNLFKIEIYDCNVGGAIDSGKWNINVNAQLILTSKKQTTTYEFVSYHKLIFMVPITSKNKFIQDFSMAKHGIDKSGRGFKIGASMNKNDFIWHAIRLEYFSYDLE